MVELVDYLKNVLLFSLTFGIGEVTSQLDIDIRRNISGNIGPSPERQQVDAINRGSVKKVMEEDGVIEGNKINKRKLVVKNN